MNFRNLAIPGCVLVEPVTHTDARGSFTKTYHAGEFVRSGLHIDFREEFVSVSHKNVLRGMHFQLPPSDHDKMVCCLKGTVLDGFVDLRKGSPAFGKSQTVTLSGENVAILFLPSGIAHGFYTLTDQAIMLYKTSSVHDPDKDAGIHWKSCGIDWPTTSPIVSLRDQGFPALDAFNSPFCFKGK